MQSSPPPPSPHLRIARSIPELVRGGGAVAYAGQLARVSHEEFVEIVEAHGGRYVPAGESPAVLVAGEHDAVLTSTGTSAVANVPPSAKLVSERAFLDALGAGDAAHRYPRLYSAPSLCELLGVSPQRLRAWVRAGLITPVLVQAGIGYFEFRQVATARNLSDAARAGVGAGEIRRTLERLRAWMPDAERALEQLAVVERTGPLLVRLEDGELADEGGQYHFDFAGEPEPEAVILSLVPGLLPKTAEAWFEQGAENERQGRLEAAEEAYRQSLAIGGPDAAACYNLANVLTARGDLPAAMERYRQTVEIDPRHADAWNNMGLLLCQLPRREEACEAFRRAVAADPQHPQAHYNLADTLDELGRYREALPHWREHARLDPLSEWGRYARARLG